MSSQDNAGDFSNDEHWGNGGRYVVGPSGRREPVAAAADVAAIDQAVNGEAVEAAATIAAKTKEKKHG